MFVIKYNCGTAYINILFSFQLKNKNVGLHVGYQQLLNRLPKKGKKNSSLIRNSLLFYSSPSICIFKWYLIHDAQHSDVVEISPVKLAFVLMWDSFFDNAVEKQILPRPNLAHLLNGPNVSFGLFFFTRRLELMPLHTHASCQPSYNLGTRTLDFLAHTIQ